jgi:uncharacterized membrane protein (DUF485 family)
MDVSGRGVDWEAIERLPAFRELVARQRRFVLPATVFFLAWYFGFVILAGYAEDFMGSSIYQGFTVGYFLALTQFAMVAGLGLSYLRYSARVLDPLREQVNRHAVNASGVAETATQDAHAIEDGRFDRPPPAESGTAPASAPDREVPR